MRRTRWSSIQACLGAGVFFLGGCQGAGPDMAILRQVDAGEYGQARGRVATRITDDRSDRAYLLDRLKLLVLDVADGQPVQAERTATELFDLLRTQGVNDDKTVASVVLNEDLKIWKGEPFEQAMAFYYIALRAALVDDWENARAAATNSLFLLRDFAKATGRANPTSEDLARAAAAAERSGKPDLLDGGYVPVRTDFALGYLMLGVAARGMNREQEALDNFTQAADIEPSLAPIVERLRAGSDNTVLFVEAGVGPRKASFGPDNALTRFEPWSDAARYERPLLTSTAAGEQSIAPAVDLNRMARDHRWNNLEDVRVGKSLIGTGLIAGGAVMATQRDRGAQWAGLGMILAGAIAKAGAHADTRYCEVLPQRVFVVPITVPPEGTRVRLGLEGGRALELELQPPRAGQRWQARAIRLPSGEPWPAWASPSPLRFSNDRTSERVPGDDRPYILGGTSLHAPTPQALARYQESGQLQGLTTADLENLYRAERIVWRPEDLRAEGVDPRHVLEGGQSLVPPLEGSTAFARLFRQPHPPYRPRSRELIEAAARFGRKESVPH